MITAPDAVDDRDHGPHGPPRAIAAPLGWARFILGIRRAVWVGQTRYKELGAEPLEHALSRRGSGAKEYRVRFADGRRMIIAATRTRRYADLVGPTGLELYQALAGVRIPPAPDDLGAPSRDALRPGMRIVALHTGTGYVGAWLSAVVGPSGAVVALDPDAESIRYARNRYRLDNVSFEAGSTDNLGGETADAFDAALAIDAIPSAEAATPMLRELWRVLRPGGRLIVATRDPADPDAESPRLRLAPEALRDLVVQALREQKPEPERVAIAPAPAASAVIAVSPEPPEAELRSIRSRGPLGGPGDTGDGDSGDGGDDREEHDER